MAERELTPAEAERAERLHRDAIVVDTAYCGPRIYSRELIDDAARRWEQGVEPATIIADYERAERRALWTTSAAQEQYREALRACGVTVGAATVGGGWTFRDAVREIAEWRELFDHLPELVLQVLGPEDVAKVKQQGRLGVVLHFQNSTHFEKDLRNVDVFFGLGVRIVQLTYNDQNLVGSGCTEPGDGGLTRFGRELLGRLNDLGLVVDLSHCGPRTSADAVRLSRAAPCATHAACAAVAKHPRNKTDEQVRAIAGHGGYFGVPILPMFLTGRAGATIDDFFAHLLHALEVAGIDHVGVGMDWICPPPAFALQMVERFVAHFERLAGITKEITLGAGITTETTGLDGVMGWPNITRGLVARGFSDEDIRKVLGLNFVRYWERVTAEAR